MNNIYPAHWVCTGDTLERDSTERDGALCLIDGFWMTCHEITQDLWDWYHGGYPSALTGNKWPVTHVTHSAVDSFCHIVYLSTRHHWRLPTREEWLFAFQGGLFSEGYRYAGSNTPDFVAWHQGNSGGKAHRVGQRIPNELGLYDMSGNISEMALEGNTLVHLGGSYLDPPLTVDHIGSGSSDPDAVGFRLVCTEPLWFDKEGKRIFR